MQGRSIISLAGGTHDRPCFIWGLIMKAFEKFWRSHLYSQLNDGPEKTAKKVEFREVWMAALGVVYDQLDYSIEHEQIKDWIEQELGD